MEPDHAPMTGSPTGNSGPATISAAVALVVTRKRRMSLIVRIANPDPPSEHTLHRDVRRREFIARVERDRHVVAENGKRSRLLQSGGLANLQLLCDLPVAIEHDEMPPFIGHAQHRVA